MNIYPIQTNFTTGILTPRLWSRSDVTEYRNGVKESSNMITLRHGPIQSRNGTDFKKDLGAYYSRPFGFQLIPNSVTGEAFSAVVSADGFIRVAGATGLLASEEEATNISFTSSLDDWSKIFTDGSSTVSWSSGAALLKPSPVNGGALAGVSQEIVFEVGTENDERKIYFNSIQVSGELSASTIVSIGTSSGANDLAEQVFNIDNGDMSFTPTGQASIWVTFSAQNQKPFQQPPGEDKPINPYGNRNLLSVSVFNITTAVAVEFAHTWTEGDIQNLNVEMSPNETAMYFVCQNTEPHKLAYDLNTNLWSFGPVVFVGTPTDWASNNYPTTMGFFQGRSWWSGVESKPQTFWGSKPNDESTVDNELEDLTIGITAADGLEFTLSRSGRIRWIEGGRNLIIGTTSGEFLINGSQGVIAPDDIFVSQQSAEGSSTVNAITIGNMVMYVSADGRRLLSTRYYEDQNQWRSQEISFTAENLTLGKRIIQIAYARNPESIIWCLLNDGSLIGCTYEPFNNLIGWHKHTIGSIQGISTTEKAGFSILSLTVERVINDATTTYLEELGFDYMDSSTLIETDSVNINVPHLAGEEVVIKIDDAQHENITLDVNGDGVLSYFSDTALIGLEMPISVETLEPDMGSNAGTSMGFNKRWSNIVVRIYDSAVPLINGERAHIRYPESPQGYREANKTIDIEVTNLGFNDGSVIVSQSLPYKLTLTGLFGKMTQSKL